MQVKAKATEWQKADADVLVVFVSEDAWEKELAGFDKACSGKLVDYLKHEHFDAKTGKILAFPTTGQFSFSSMLISGIGKLAELDLNVLRKAAASSANVARNSHKQLLAIDLTTSSLFKLNLTEVSQAVVEGVILGTYAFSKYRSEDKKTPKQINQVLLLTTPGKLQHVANGIPNGEIYANATNFSRDLVNESPTITTPTFMSAVAKSLARRGEISVEVFSETEARKLGMNAFLAVARGSSEAPKFIKLTYSGGKKKVVLCGKAITFDTGGLSLKDAKNMETMKLDMAGAAAVLGIFKALTLLKPKVTVVGLIAACENMPGSKASKPGDIVTALNGKTIEILNTDAEGRLTLADVLSYAVKEKPEVIIDLATLTGACMVALGQDIAGLFSNNQELKQLLLNAAAKSGEKIWELPLEKDYIDNIKSEFADLRNISKVQYGGAITAALFLEEFVDTFSWAHLDIAGPAWAENKSALTPKGGTGFGVRTILNFIQKL